MKRLKFKTMDKSQINDYIDTGIKIGIIAFVIIYSKRIFNTIYNAVAGQDKMVSMIELGAVWGIWRLDYMLRAEASRVHEWSVFGNYYIIGMMIFILLCFGFKDIVKLFISKKFSSSESTSIEVTKTTQGQTPEKEVIDMSKEP